jgi:hypothetical protein
MDKLTKFTVILIDLYVCPLCGAADVQPNIVSIQVFLNISRVTEATASVILQRKSGKSLSLVW